jgi:hypothetical protein
MHGRMCGDRVVIACGSDSTRPVIFRTGRIDAE